MHLKVNNLVFIIVCAIAASSCATSRKSETPANTTAEAPITQEQLPEPETVETLSRDVDSLQRKLIGYIGPLSAKQEDEVEDLKQQIHAKEMKKANLELKTMLGEIKEEE